MAGEDGPELTPGAQRILDAASELFYRHGIHAMGVDAIAAESGVTKRTLYNRFGSKDQLVTCYLKQRHDRWWNRLEDRLATAGQPRALAIFDAYVYDAPSIDRGCAFINAAAELPLDHPGHAVIRAHKKAVVQRMAEVVAEDNPQLADPAAMAEHLFLILEGAVAQRGIDGSEQRFARARDLASRILSSEAA